MPRRWYPVRPAKDVATLKHTKGQHLSSLLARQKSGEDCGRATKERVVRQKQLFHPLSSRFQNLQPSETLVFTVFAILIAVLSASIVSGYSYADENQIRQFDEIREQYDRFSEHFLLPEDFDLADQIPVHRPTTDELDEIQNSALFEGDILGINPRHSMFQQDDNDGDYDSDGLFEQPYYSALNTATYADKLWHKARVPYILEEGMASSQRAAIASAFDEYKGKTCVKFVPKDDHDRDYIYIKRNIGMGCSSYVGRAGGNQTVSLEVDKCFSKGIIAHELMHALGFFHEHSRTDRDEFVDIMEENIRSGMMRNFEKYPRKIVDTLDMPYDYESVMHYHKLAFSKNGKATIVPRKKDAEIGQRYRLSVIDQRKINKLYNCPEETHGSTLSSTTARTLPPTTASSPTPTTSEAFSTTPDEELITTTTTTTDETATTDESPSPEITTSVGTLPPEGGGTDETPSATFSPDPEEATTTTTTPEPTTSPGDVTVGETSPRARQTAKPATTSGAAWPDFAKNLITFSIMTISRGGKNGGWPPTIGVWGSGNRTTDVGTSAREKGAPPPKRKKLERIIDPGVTGRISGTRNRAKLKLNKQTEDRSEICEDRNAHCSMWQKLGHCEHSPKYMSAYCRKSCQLCNSDGVPREVDEEENKTVACSDRNIFCEYWARQGECEGDSRFMRVFCRLSCGHC